MALVSLSGCHSADPLPACATFHDEVVFPVQEEKRKGVGMHQGRIPQGERTNVCRLER